MVGQSIDLLEFDFFARMLEFPYSVIFRLKGDVFGFFLVVEKHNSGVKDGGPGKFQLNQIAVLETKRVRFSDDVLAALRLIFKGFFISIVPELDVSFDNESDPAFMRMSFPIPLIFYKRTR